MKLVVALIVILLMVQVAFGFVVNLFKRESENDADTAPGGGQIEKTIDGSLSGWKDGIDHFFKSGIQADGLFKDLTGNIQHFSNNVAGAGKDFVNQLQYKTDDMITKLKKDQE